MFRPANFNRISLKLSSIFFVVGAAWGCTQTAKQDQVEVLPPVTVGTLIQPSILEIIKNEKDELINDSLVAVAGRNKILNVKIYKWNNHYVIFGGIVNPGILEKEIISEFPNSTVKLYTDLFYEFDRKKHCTDSTYAKQGEDIILTANLVKDTSLQKEYLEYHASQFSKWPEVSNGFCNAEFQRLLVFRNGRQLMLVITIPKGKTLDELNPKTTENNPRVDEWNNLMKKYQEGIEGTKPGETWVFLKPVVQN